MRKRSRYALLLWLLFCCLAPVAASADTPSPEQLAEERKLAAMYPGYRGVDAHDKAT